MGRKFIKIARKVRNERKAWSGPPGLPVSTESDEVPNRRRLKLDAVRAARKKDGRA